MGSENDRHSAARPTREVPPVSVSGISAWESRVACSSPSSPRSRYVGLLLAVPIATIAIETIRTLKRHGYFDDEPEAETAPAASAD